MMTRDLKDSELYEERYRLKERRSNTRFCVALCILAFFLIGFRYYWTSTFGGVAVDGDSMYSTLIDGEELLIRYVRNGEGLKRGDIIVVHVEDYPELQAYNANRPDTEKVKYLIKRLIAVEGDKVKCVDGQIYIQYAGTDVFEALDEPYAHYYEWRVDYVVSDAAKATYDFAEYTVGEGEIFFLGDNRKFSMDSRYQDGNSHLSNSLYKATDVFGVVPEWALKWQPVLEKLFF